MLLNKLEDLVHNNYNNYEKVPKNGKKKLGEQLGDNGVFLCYNNLIGFIVMCYDDVYSMQLTIFTKKILNNAHRPGHVLGALHEAQLRARFLHNMHILITTDTTQIRKNSGKIQLYVKEQQQSKSTVFVSCPTFLLMPRDPAFCGGYFSRCTQSPFQEFPGPVAPRRVLTFRKHSKPPVYSLTTVHACGVCPILCTGHGQRAIYNPGVGSN